MQTDDPGYWIVPSVLSGDECDALIRAIGGFTRSRAGARHLMRFTEIAGVAKDDRLIQIAAGRLGGTAIPFRATLFDKSLAANWLVPWHQDTALPLVARHRLSGWGPWAVKDGILYAHAPAWALQRVAALRLHLDESGEENGPLRVVPYSHRFGVLADNDVEERIRPLQPMTCPVPRGGVLAMSPLLVHASSKALDNRSRRVLHIEYADSLDLGGGICLALA